jgi:hypothetical protein
MCSAGYAVRAAREALPGRLLPPHPCTAARSRGKHNMAFGWRRWAATAELASRREVLGASERESDIAALRGGWGKDSKLKRGTRAEEDNLLDAAGERCVDQ